MHSKVKGFSLIELIAVIIVIVILSAVLIARYGNVSNGARNANIKQFISDCKGVYAKMYYGDSTTTPPYTTVTGTKHLRDYMSGGSVANAAVRITGTTLVVSSIPTDAKMFKIPLTGFQANYANNVYSMDDGSSWISESNFMSQISW